MTTPTLEAAADQGNQKAIAVSAGNSPWAHDYARELRSTVLRYTARLPRNVQRHLGPSELDHACDRQVIGKMAGAYLERGVESDNHVSDPWASIVGTALHGYLEQAFGWDSHNGPVAGRWLTERKVVPDPGSAQPHPGTADLYDKATRTLVDHKCQGESVRDALRRHGPPQHYFGQMLLYAVGYMHAGYEVDRIVLASWPRTKSSLDDFYCWEHPVTAADIQYVIDLIARTETREHVARYVAAGELDLFEIPATPADASCHYCPFYRPQAAYDATIRGCPGTVRQR